jgi:hypothetical protein
MCGLFDRTAVVTALILERPLCLSCIAERSEVSKERAEATLKAIGGALVLRSTTGRCAACEETTTVHSIG